MPAWWQAPILTGKARGEKSNPESSVAHQALTSPPAGFHQPGLWVVHLGGFTCAITEDVFLHLDYKGSRSLQCSGLLQIKTPLYPSSSASHSAIPSINFTDDYLENRKVWMVSLSFCFSFIFCLLPVLWSGKIQEKATPLPLCALSLSQVGMHIAHAIDLA